MLTTLFLCDLTIANDISCPDICDDFHAYNCWQMTIFTANNLRPLVYLVNFAQSNEDSEIINYRGCQRFMTKDNLFLNNEGDDCYLESSSHFSQFNLRMPQMFNAQFLNRKELEIISENKPRLYDTFLNEGQIYNIIKIGINSYGDTVITTDKPFVQDIVKCAKIPKRYFEQNQ